MTDLHASADPDVTDDAAPDELRRFRASTFDEALAAAAAEIGSDVEVVEANRIRRGGLGGFFATDLGVEVIVASKDAPGQRAEVDRAVDRLLDRLDVSDRYVPSDGPTVASGPVATDASPAVVAPRPPVAPAPAADVTGPDVPPHPFAARLEREMLAMPDVAADALGEPVRDESAEVDAESDSRVDVAGGVAGAVPGAVLGAADDADATIALPRPLDDLLSPVTVPGDRPSPVVHPVGGLTAPLDEPADPLPGRSAGAPPTDPIPGRSADAPLADPIPGRSDGAVDGSAADGNGEHLGAHGTTTTTALDASLSDLDDLLRRAGVTPPSAVPATPASHESHPRSEAPADPGPTGSTRATDDRDAPGAPEPDATDGSDDATPAPSPLRAMPTNDVVRTAAETVATHLATVDAATGLTSRALRRVKMRITTPDGTEITMTAEWDDDA